MEPVKMFKDNNGPEGCPTRSFSEPKVWRQGGPPDYTIVNRKFMAQKLSNHKEGSLESIVEGLVKNWESEASHKPDPKTWDTIDYDNWTIKGNNGRTFKPDEAVKVGNYNVLLDDADKTLGSFRNKYFG